MTTFSFSKHATLMLPHVKKKTDFKKQVTQLFLYEVEHLPHPKALQFLKIITTL